MKAAAELCQYSAPKRKAVEHSGELILNMSAMAERLREARRRVAEMQTIDVKAIPEPDAE
jgi:hypothetical protein